MEIWTVSLYGVTWASRSVFWELSCQHFWKSPMATMRNTILCLFCYLSSLICYKLCPSEVPRITFESNKHSSLAVTKVSLWIQKSQSFLSAQCRVCELLFNFKTWKC